jgi:hypothetical protein
MWADDEGLPDRARRLAGEHQVLLRWVRASGDVVEVSRWNAPREIMDPPMVMTGVDAAASETLEVEAVPMDIDRKLTDPEMEAILANFLKFCDAVRPLMAE